MGESSPILHQNPSELWNSQCLKQTQQTFKKIFDAQKANQYKVGNSTAKERIQKLDKLYVAVEKTYRQEIREAMYQDFRKASFRSRFD